MQALHAADSTANFADDPRLILERSAAHDYDTLAASRSSGHVRRARPGEYRAINPVARHDMDAVVAFCWERGQLRQDFIEVPAVRLSPGSIAKTLAEHPPHCWFGFAMRADPPYRHVSSEYWSRRPKVNLRTKTPDRPSNVSPIKTDATVVSFDPSPFQWVDPEKIAPREWLYDSHLIRRYVSGTISPGGVGKSALKIAEAISMATGKGLLTGKPGRPLTVWYWNGEDPEEETQRRVAAACKHYGVSADDLGGRLYLDSGRKTKIVLAKESRAGLIVAHPIRQALIEAIQKLKIDVVIIDPFVRSHEVSENDNSKMESVVDEFRQIADATNCAVELVHHSRKTGGAEVTAEDARGGSALISAVRSARVLNQMNTDEARANRVPATERRQYFRMDDGKVNLAPHAPANRWFKIEGVMLGNGRPGLAQDSVGVVTPWTKPATTDGLARNAVEIAQAAIAGGEWRENVQSGEKWVGRPIAEVLGFALDDSTQKARVNDLVKEWIKAGYLKIVEHEDEHRKLRKYVESGSPFWPE